MRCIPACRLFLASSVILALFAVVPGSSAQSTGAVTGTVTDTTHAIVPGAALRLTNTATNVSLTTRSNANGLFNFSPVTPGTYTLAGAAKGFSARVLSGIVVDVGRTTSVDLVFSIGIVSQRVTVNGGLQSLDTSNGYKGQVITSRQVENLPLQSRSPLALMTLAPGVAASGPTISGRQASDGTSDTSEYSINGGVPTTAGGFNEYLVDGISMTDLRGNIDALPSAGAIQEFQVQSGGLPPAFGNTVGGVSNYVTKSGTNTFHGFLFEDYRGTATNARAGVPVGSPPAANNFNQFGGNFGGPVWIPKVYNGHNRTFFFVDYDGSRWVRKTPETGTFPTALMHQGIFTDVTTRIYDPDSSANPATRTAFSNQTIPAARFNPIGAKIMSLMPLPNLPGTANNFSGIRNVFTPVDIITARVDQSIGTRQRLGFKLTRVNSTSTELEFEPNYSSDQDIIFPTRNYTALYDLFISPTLTYSAAAGYTHFLRIYYDNSGNTVGGAYFGYTVNPPPASGSFANVRPTATFDLYPGIGTGAPQDQVSLTYQLNQALRWSVGKHFVTFGADLRRYHFSGLISAGDPNGSFAFSASQTSNGTSNSGNSAASLLLGLPNTEIFQQEPSISLTNFLNAFYVSDDYKITPSLVLNLGFRYEYLTSVTEGTNKSGWFDSTDINSLVGVPGVFRYAGLNGNTGDITTGQYDRIAPRVGFAYSPGMLANKTVIRGAFGLIYAPIPAIGYLAPGAGFDSTLNPLKASSTASSGVLGSSYTLPAISGQQGDAAFLGLGVTAPLNRFAKGPSVYEWNFGVQQALPNNFICEVQYVGNRGEHLLATESIDLPNYGIIQSAIAAEQAAGGKSGTALAYLNETVSNPLAGKVPGTLGANTITLENESKLFPQFSSVAVLKGDRDSDYQSLQATLQRRVGANLNLSLSYTFSKLIDNAVDLNAANTGTWQNPYDLRDARGVSAYNSTHIFAGSGVYSVPFGRSRQFLKSGLGAALAGGFQLTGFATGLSGVPLAITQSAANGLGVASARPNKIGNPVTAHARNANGSIQWINSAAYSVADGNFGTSPIRDGKLLAPNYWDVDLGLQRTFPLYERLNLQFRVEAFNSLNHQNLGQPTQVVGNAAFGQINAINGYARAVQIDAHLSF